MPHALRRLAADHFKWVNAGVFRQFKQIIQPRRRGYNRVLRPQPCHRIPLREVLQISKAADIFALQRIEDISPRLRNRRCIKRLNTLLLLHLALCRAALSIQPLLDLAADVIAALRLLALVATAGALAALYRCRTLVRAGARLLRVRLLRTCQRRKLVLLYLTVRFHFLGVQIVQAALVSIVQIKLEDIITLAQLVGGRLIEAIALELGRPLLDQPLVDGFRAGDLALRGLEHLCDVLPQLARQLDHAACLQILERGLNLLCRLTGVLSGQTAAAARHGVGPV